MKKIILFGIVLMGLYSTSLFSQTAPDSSYNKQIATIESKISEIKNLPIEKQKKYYSVLSDVENRKNTLKSLLKTPVGKRNKAWEDSWNQNYSKASAKLENIQIK